MGQYCDSALLENNWFHWLLSSSVPDLELYRRHDLLWTKVVGNVSEKGKILPDPCHPIREHCIALSKPIYFSSNDGILQSGVVHTKNGPREHPLPSEKVISLLSNSWLHDLTNPFVQRDYVIPHLLREGYIKESLIETSWHAILIDVNNICYGIAMRFKLSSPEETSDLANEALIQVTNKIKNHKLVYSPGRAPVFNLLTTTIYRIMYSIMNKRKNQKKGIQKLKADVQAGIVPQFTQSRKARSAIKTH